MCMAIELTIELEYGGGNVGIRFTGDSYPDNWNEIIETARSEVKKELYEIADIHEWRDSFETAQEYSPPGRSPEPEVGTLIVSENGDLTVDLAINSVEDCEWT